MEGNVKKPTENNMFAQYIYGTQNVPKLFHEHWIGIDGRSILPVTRSNLTKCQIMPDLATFWIRRIYVPVRLKRLVQPPTSLVWPKVQSLIGLNMICEVKPIISNIFQIIYVLYFNFVTSWGTKRDQTGVLLRRAVTLAVREVRSDEYERTSSQNKKLPNRP